MNCASVYSYYLTKYILGDFCREFVPSTNLYHLPTVQSLTLLSKPSAMVFSLFISLLYYLISSFQSNFLFPDSKKNTALNPMKKDLNTCHSQ